VQLHSGPWVGHPVVLSRMQLPACGVVGTRVEPASDCCWCWPGIMWCGHLPSPAALTSAAPASNHAAGACPRTVEAGERVALQVQQVPRSRLLGRRFINSLHGNRPV
jgi:hypothetical protein